MSKLLNITDLLEKACYHEHFEDFGDQSAVTNTWLVSADNATADDLTISVLAAGGVLPLNAGGIGDNEGTLIYRDDLLKFAAGKPFRIGSRVQYTEANTDDANMFFGVKSGPAVGDLGHDGVGIADSDYYGAVIMKLDGKTVWEAESACGTTILGTESDITAGGSDYQDLIIEFQPLTATTGEVRFSVGAEQIAKHTIDFTNAVVMQVFFGVLNGSANNLETLNIDYEYGRQLR
jgi:hypothetical protein